MMNMYGLRVSLCIFPRLISMGSVVLEWLLVKDVIEFLYIFPTISTAFRGQPRFSMMARSLA